MAVDDRSAELDLDRDHLRALINTAGIGLWWRHVETAKIVLNERSLQLGSQRQGSVATFDDLSATS